MAHDPAWAEMLARQRRFDEAAPVARVDMQVEQARKLQRLKAMKSARAVVCSSGSGIDCVVRSLSPSGARLTFADPVDLPAQFELYLLTENVRVGVSLAWRKGLDAGVKFDKPLIWLTKHVAAKRF